jgi:hypothetical protein
MSWKPKEKELTQDEAIEAAKVELAPFWFGTTPQIAGVKNDNQYQVFPIDSEFFKKAWLFFFVDPTDFSGETAFVFAKEWYKRFNSHGINILLIIYSVYGYLKVPATIREILDEHAIKFAVVMDVEGTILGAFGVLATPKIQLFSEGKTFFEFFGKDWLGQAELEIQTFLRVKDPGLPLLPMFSPQKGVARDIRRMEFGAQPRTGESVIFPEPGFVGDLKDGFRKGQFHGMGPKSLGPLDFYISGIWNQDDERILTSDPNALIMFRCSSAKISIVVESHSKTVEKSLLAVEINGVPAHEAIAGDTILMDDTGRSVIKVGKAHLNHLLTNMNHESKEITFRFPNADMAPLAIYGIRVGE